MGEIVNLRRVKKQLARDAAAKQAAENRARHGQSAATREEAERRRGMLERGLDGAQVEPSPNPLPEEEG